MGPWAPPPWVWWPRSQGHSAGPETTLCSTLVLRHTGDWPWGWAAGLSLFSLSLLLSWSSTLLSHTSFCVSLSLGICLSLFLRLSLSLYFPPASIFVLFLASFHRGSLSFCAFTVSLRLFLLGQGPLSLPSSETFIPSFLVPGDWKLQPHPNADLHGQLHRP